MQEWGLLKKIHLYLHVYKNSVVFDIPLFGPSFTGKSFSEALILESVNPQYDKRLFIEFPEKYKFRTCCVQKLFLLFLFWQCSELVFFGEFNEQSLVILWVNWCKNEGFWKRFTCNDQTTIIFKFIEKIIVDRTGQLQPFATFPLIILGIENLTFPLAKVT